MDESTVTKGDIVVAMFDDGTMLSLGQGWKSTDEVEDYLDAEYPNKTGETRLFIDEWVYDRPHSTPHEGMTDADMDKLTEVEAILDSVDEIQSVWRPEPSTSETLSYRGGEEIHSTASDWDICVTIRDVEGLDRHVENTLGAEPVDAYAATLVNDVLIDNETTAELEIVGARKHDTDDRRRFMISAYFRLCREDDPSNIILRQYLQTLDSVQAAYLPDERVHKWSGWVGDEPDEDNVDVYVRLNNEHEPNVDHEYETVFSGDEFGPFTEKELTEQVRDVVEQVNSESQIDKNVQHVGIGQVMTRFKGNFVPMAALQFVSDDE